jgi:hypothetical protein
MAINFNIDPYFDDYDERDKFYRLLFRPGYPVQARELTQMQSILQNQIAKHAEHIFKQGSMVIPGQVSYEDDFKYVKLQSIYNGVDVNTYLDEIVGQEIIGQSSGVKAFVLHVEKQTDLDPPTVYVRYNKSGADSDGNPTDVKIFQNDEIISCETLSVPRAFRSIATSATGLGTGASIESGVYYVDKFFVLVDAQKITLDKYSATPSYRVGLNVVETLVTPEDNADLLDNAIGSSNYTAPGAHRYKIELVLSKRSLTSEDDKNFVELLRLEEGKIIYKTRTTDYSILEKTLARRTSDESGDYVINNFNFEVREHRNNDRGTWVANRSYLQGDVVNYTFGGIEQKFVAKNSGISGSSPPIHTSGETRDGETGIIWLYNKTPFYNRGVYSPEDGGDEAKIAIGMEPGKAYISGYEVEKVGVEYLAIEKARDFERAQDVQCQTIVGNYIYATNIFGAPRIDLFETVDLYDRFVTVGGTAPAGATKIGTARVRGLNLFDRRNTVSDDVYELMLFDINIIPGKSLDNDLKGLHNSNFTANIFPVINKLNGSATASNSTTIVGTGTTFDTDFNVGDYIALGDADTLRRIVTITNDNTIVVDTAATVTGVVIYKVVTSLYEPNYSSLLFKLPYFDVRKIRGSDDTTLRTSYTVTQVFTTASSAITNGNSYVVIDSKRNNETFLPASDPQNYVLINTTTGLPVIPSNINVVLPELRQVEFTVPSANANNQFVVYAGVKKTTTAAKEKTKTSVTFETIQVETQTAAQAKEISLGKADVFNIVSIKMANTFGDITEQNPANVDIVDYYELDFNITDSFYGISKLILKQGYPLPTGSIEVVFDYFSHGPGDYFSVDSYIGSGIKFEDLPRYGASSSRDILDFRPRIDSSGSFNINLGAVLSELPKRGDNAELDLSYYLARKDKISIDFRGKFFVTKGIPSLFPIEPETPQNSMLLYGVSLIPYTYKPRAPDVNVTSVDNKRYTMRDIGKLEKRIDNLEYYTTLNMLETETANSKITDENGLDRFKNGFLVDNFAGHGIGNAEDPDYKCSIDLENKELRPFFRMENVNLVERASNDGQRTLNNYQATGDIITLPYTEQALIKQNISSRTENVNPFAVFTFIGRIDLNPSSDDWFEVERRPDIIVNVEGNFNTIQTLSEKAGVLGTVWNSWQTQWTGATQTLGRTVFTSGDNWASRRGDVFLSIGEFQQRFGGPGSNHWNARQVTAEVTATQVGQTRTGTQTKVAVQIDRRLVEDRVLSTAVLPYIRSRNVLFQVTGLKPSTKFYAFFDSVAISKYITPATKISFDEITGFSSNFESKKNAGATASDPARRLAGDPADTPQVGLNRGDVITGQTSGATAVVVGTELSNETDARAIYVLNIKGTFQVNEVIVGNISGARGTINASVTPKVKGDQMTTNFNGSLFGLFDIPNTEAVRFRTGTREFRLADTTGYEDDYNSYAVADYKAEGILQVKQATVEAVRNGIIVQETVQESRTIVETADRVVADTGWYDPLAQTFLVQQKGGAFLTSIDLFFATKDANIPVKIEIREVVNGYPGKKILPFSQVVKNPEDVNISTRKVTIPAMNNKIASAPDVATKFTFPSPVYVKDGTEYCIVIISDSNNYNVWVSHLGDKIPGTDRFVSEQPYQGVFFKSQNASTWTPDDYKDLCFIIHRAKFNTAVTGRVEFTNDVLPKTRLEVNPIQTTNGSSMIRVYHENHNMPVGSKVQLSGFTATQTYNGILGARLNGVHTVGAADLDAYTITLTGVSSTANLTGFTGGENIYASDNILMTSIQANAQIQTFPDASMIWEATTTSGQSVDGTEVPYIQSVIPIPVTINDVTNFAEPQIVASELNEQQLLSGSKSFEIAAVMSSTNDAVSPVIDTHRTSLIAIHNKVNNANSLNMNISPVDDILLVDNSTAIAFASDRITTTNTQVKERLSFIPVGRYIRIDGALATGNSGTALVTEVAADGSYVKVNKTFTIAAAGAGTAGTIDVNVLNNFVDEIAPSRGSQYSKYLSKRVNLANPSTFFNIRFAACVPTSSDVDLYYRLNKVGATTLFDETTWIKINPDIEITKSNNNLDFTDVVYSAKDLPSFDAIQVKLVFRTTNNCRVPRIKDLRIVACA